MPTQTYYKNKLQWFIANQLNFVTKIFKPHFDWSAIGKKYFQIQKVISDGCYGHMAYPWDTYYPFLNPDKNHEELLPDSDFQLQLNALKMNKSQRFRYSTANMHPERHEGQLNSLSETSCTPQENCSVVRLEQIHVLCPKQTWLESARFSQAVDSFFHCTVLHV